MHIRSRAWKTESGTANTLNLSCIDFEQDYPEVSSFYRPLFTNSIPINHYKRVSPQTLVSSFVSDYILERFWKNPIKYVPYFEDCACILSPDYSLLIGMPRPVLQWNVYRSRLVGYVWQKMGLPVIPTIGWADARSFGFCFNGIANGSVVAVSNVGCRNDTHRTFFDAGYNAMIAAINPCFIVFQCRASLRKYYEAENVIFIPTYFEEKRDKWAVEVDSL